MKNLPKEKRDRIILICMGTVIVLVAAWFGLVKAQEKSLETTRKNILEQQARLDSGKRLVSSTPDVERRLQVSSSKLNELEAGMATGDMYSWIILKVNKFRVGYNVDIPQFSREITGEVGVLPRFPYKAATFNIRGSAYFHDFGRFLADFENSFPYIRVQNIELEPAGTSTTAGAAAANDDPEKIAFRMELVTLINPVAR